MKRGPYILTFLAMFLAILVLLPDRSDAVEIRRLVGLPSQVEVAQPFAGWADRSKAPMPAIRVHVETGAEADRICAGGDATNTSTLGCGGLLGWILIRTSIPQKELAPWKMVDIFYHEMGHQFYMSKVSKPNAEQFVRAAGYQRTLRRLSPAARSHMISELFAEGYRLCARYGEAYPKRGFAYTAYGYDVNRVEHVRVCRLIGRIGRLPVYVEPEIYFGSPFIVEPGEIETLLIPPVVITDPVNPQPPVVVDPISCTDNPAHQHDDPSLPDYCPE